MSQLIRWAFRVRLVASIARSRWCAGGVAYTGPYPIRSHRTMAQVMADEARAERPDWYSEFVSPAGDDHKADSASGLEGSAAEVTSGAPAGHGHTSNPANADQSRALLPLSQPKAIDLVAIDPGGCAPPVFIIPEPAAYPLPGDAEPAPSVAVPIAATDGGLLDDDEDHVPAEIRPGPKGRYPGLRAL